jgi:diguanylate cyclase (GGDEF)-like protein/PAS domain S-box-containing protein
VRWFLDLSTRAKLHAVFAVMIALLAVVAAAAYRSLAIMQDSQTALYEQEFRDVVEIRAVRHNQIANRADLLDIMVPGSRAEIGALEKGIQERVKRTDESVRRLLERNRTQSESRKALEEFESLRRGSLQTRETQTLPLIRAGKLDEARQLHLGIQAARDAQMEAIADAFVAHTEQAARAALARSEEMAGELARVILITGVVAILLAAAMTVLLNRVLSDPLKELSAAAERVAAGDLTVDVPAGGRADETGTLLQTFARMLASLRQTTRDLSTEKQLLHNLMDSVPDAIFFKDREHRFLRVNRVHASNVLGVARPEDAVGRPTSDFFPPDEARQRDAEDDEILRTGTARPDKVRRITLAGNKVRWSSTTKAPVKDETGQVTGLVGIARDVTERQRLQEELREREAGLRRAQLMAKLAHVITRPDGSFESWSETLPQLIGLGDERMPKSTREWLKIVHPDDQERFRQRAIDAGATAGRLELEYRLRRADGAWIDVRQVSEPMQVAAGAPNRWFGTLQDVTEQKEAEEKIGRLNRVYAVLSGINGLIVRERNREQLFREACRIAVEAGKLRFVWIGVVDQQAMQLRPVAWSGEERDFLTAVAGRLSLSESDSQARSLVAQAAVAKEALISNDVAHDPRIRFKQEHAQRGIRSLAALPLMLADKVFGVLALHAAEVGFFDDDEMRLLLELAADISFGLEHIDKEEKVMRLNRVYAVLSGINSLIVRVRDREELYREACRIAVHAGGFKLAWIGSVERDAMRVTPVAFDGDAQGYIDRMPMALDEGAKEGRGLSGQAVRERKPMIANDIENDTRILLRTEALKRGFRSLAVLPLVVSDSVAGVLALYAESTGFFDGEEMRLLVELAGDISFALEHLEQEDKLDYLAYYDSITGLANRTLFRERLQHHLREATRAQGQLAVIVVDIERFRTINDTFGRQAGDALLKQMAERFREVAGDPDTLARLGADHFAVVIPYVRVEQDLVRMIEAARSRILAQPFSVDGTELRIATKAGIALFPNDGADADVLLRNAEAALRKAKISGEKHLFYTQQMTERVAEKLALENKLRQALEKDEFVLHYQPKVELEKRTIVGLEALIRWQSPELGLVPPGKFIPLLEETGLILEVGSWALARAALDHRRWFEAGLKPPRVAVNVSPIQLRQRDFASIVEQAVLEGIAPVAIDLEITESLIMEEVEATIEKLKNAQALGIKIAIDDFGTGYSSLAYLSKLPVETLKIDRSFIITMLADPDVATLVRTIITLAHSLRLTVVAEGVDAEEQAKLLRLLKCDQMQGYLFSKPLPPEQITALLKANGHS